MQARRLAHRAGGLALPVVILLAIGFAGTAAFMLGKQVLIASTYFDGYFANGAFQLLNPLRRVLDGQVLGRDFQNFHGIGAVWAHVPAFVAFGQDLRASEIARNLTSGLLYALACACLGLALRGYGRDRAVLFTLLLFASGPFLYPNTFFPQNSLLGVRSAMPLFVAAAVLLGRAPLTVTVTTGLALVVSVEHGVASLGALALATLATLLVMDRQTASRLALGAVGGVLVALAVLAVATRGDLASVLGYLFVAIPTDQFWYFGAPPNAYAPRDWQIFIVQPELHRYLTVLALAWGATAIISRWRPDVFAGCLFLAAYATAGAVSQLGFLGAYNLHAPERAAFAAVLLAIIALPRHPLLPALGGVAVMAHMLIWAGYSARRYPQPAWPPHQEGYLSDYWSEHLRSVEAVSPSGHIWSVYAGLPEFVRGQFGPSFDYIIHALGPENRARYLAEFLATRPDLVRLDNATTWPYGPWLFDTSWPFYREVFDRYALAHRDRGSTLWTPRPEGAVAAREPVPVVQGVEGCWSFRAAEAGIYTAEARYDVADAWAWVPLLGKTRRLFVDRRGDASRIAAVSLPPAKPYGGRFAFPVLVAEPGEITLCPHTDGFFTNAKLTLRAVTVERDGVDDATRDYLLESSRPPR